MNSPLPSDPGQPSQKLLQVLLLGPLRATLQTDIWRMTCPVDGSQEAFWDSLLERFPELKGNRSVIRLARNNQFLQPDDRLNPGDEIALIPPVSGG